MGEALVQFLVNDIERILLQDCTESIIDFVSEHR
jgi:hypothetical protein